MTLDETQLAIVLQASVDRAGELLRQDGGFLPFGARAKPTGEIDFIQIAPENDAEPLDALLRRLSKLLASEAAQHEIVGSALVVNAHVPDQEDGNAVAVLVETAGFSRSIVVPYRVEADGVKLGEMIPQPAEPCVFGEASEAS